MAVSAKTKSNPLGLANPGYLTVATYGTDLPSLLVNNGQLSHTDGKLINEFAKSEGLKLKLIQTTFASTILEVEDHRADLGLGYFYWSRP